MPKVEQVLDLPLKDRIGYSAQKLVARVATHTALRDDVPLTEGTPGLISQAVKDRMGVKRMKIHAPLAEDPFHPEHRALVDGIMGVREETLATIVDEASQANIIFMEGSETEFHKGMLDYTGAKHQGVNGVAVTNERQAHEKPLSTLSLWRTLGHSATKYAIQPIVEERDTFGFNYIGYDLGSMEGALHGSDVRDGYLDFSERLAYMAASEYVTNNDTESANPVVLRDGEIPKPMSEVMQMCAALREFGFMPPLNLDDLVPAERAELLKRYMGQSGLSTGNASVWDLRDNVMMITASGVDKGNLKRHEVLRIPRFNNTFDGVVVQPYQVEGKVKSTKASVEAFGNMATYLTSLGIESGRITDGSLDQILNYIQDQELIDYDLAQGFQPKYLRQLHFHAHPIAWNPDLVTVVEPNANLVHGGDAHASCGTRPESLYTTEMGGRGMLHDKGNKAPKIIIAKMQEHGSEVISPYDMYTTLRILNPRREEPSLIKRSFPDTLFAPVVRK